MNVAEQNWEPVWEQIWTRPIRIVASVDAWIKEEVDFKVEVQLQDRIEEPCEYVENSVHLRIQRTAQEAYEQEKEAP